MTLFECNSQYRERAAIWRLFSWLPLHAGLAGGKVYKWFAINVPMDLGTGGEFTSDIDILGYFHDFPRSKRWFFRTWEVKVSLLYKDGTARSLKVGKLGRTITQLNAYSKFGSPEVSLLDVYLCQPGFFGTNPFPPPSLLPALHHKIPELKKAGFGYQVLPFEHGNDDGTDVGLIAFGNPYGHVGSNLNVLPPRISQPSEPFTRLAEQLKNFFVARKVDGTGTPRQITFCRECRQLQFVNMKEEYECPNCRSDLIMQS